MMEFSPEQQAALERRHHTLVKAGAGSGKTRVIVEWYCRAFLEYFPDAQIDQIVAVTFTEKAAGELRERVRRRLRELARIGDESIRQRCSMLNSFLVLAPIGTIHSFCAHLLRDYWREAGLDPEFKVIDQVWQHQVLNEAIEHTIASWEEGTADQQAKLVALLAAYGSVRAIKRELRKMLRERAKFIEAVNYFTARSADDLHQEFVAEETVLETCASSIVEKTNIIVNKLRNSKWDETHPFTHRLREAMSIYESSTAEAGENVRAAWEMLRLLIDDEGNPRAEYREALQRRQLVASTEVGNLAIKIRGLLDSSHVGTRACLALSKLMGELFLDALVNYNCRCDGRRNAERCDLFDFAELELRTYNLLRHHPEVRRALHQKLKALIVDEFQDTSTLQWEIFRLILEPDDLSEATPTRAAGPCLFAVGDQAQGIYGWRQADHQVFRMAEQWMHGAGRDGKVLSLKTNYRTQEPLVGIINRLCAEVFKQTASPNSHANIEPYEALAANRSDEGGKALWLLTNLHSDENSEEDAPSQASTTEDTGGTELPSVAQVRNVVRVLENLLSAQSQTCLVLGQPLSWKDVAFLCRKRRFFPVIESVLRTKGIPFLTHGGSGFYAQPEVVGILNALRVIADKHDDFAALGFLRGAFVRCSDELLLKISQRPGPSLWEKARCAYQESDEHELTLSEAERTILRLAVRAIEKASERVGALTVDRLLEDLMEQLGAWGTAATLDNPKQAQQNLLKLVSIGRQFRTTSLETFLAYLDEIEESEEQEGQAVLAEESADAVKVMTIHAAKGLEFPVVVLPFLEDKFNLRVSFPVSDGRKWYACSRSLAFGADADTTAGTKFYLTELEKQRQLDEEKRVLYVALTRARDLLILSSAETKRRGKSEKEEAQCVADWLGKHLPFELVESEDGLYSLASTRNTHRALALQLGTLNQERAHDEEVVPRPERMDVLFEQFQNQARRAAISNGYFTADSLAGFYERPPLAPPTVVGHEVIFLGVSELLTFLQCPEKYYYQYVLELPDNGLRKSDSEIFDSPDSLSVLSLSERGTILHEIFEKALSTSPRPTPQDLKALVEAALRLRLPAEALTSQKELLDDLYSHALAALSSGKFTRIREAQYRVFEVPLTKSIDDHFIISGTVDCLFAEPDGVVEIADFKTGSSHEAEDPLSQYYDFQMRMYLWMLAPLVAGQEHFRATLIFTQEGGQSKEVCMTRQEIATFAEYLRKVAHEFRQFQRQFTDGDVVPSPELCHRLAQACAQRERPCPEHSRYTMNNRNEL